MTNESVSLIFCHGRSNFNAPLRSGEACFVTTPSNTPVGIEEGLLSNVHEIHK